MSSAKEVAYLSEYGRFGPAKMACCLAVAAIIGGLVCWFVYTMMLAMHEVEATSERRGSQSQRYREAERTFPHGNHYPLLRVPK